MNRINVKTRFVKFRPLVLNFNIEYTSINVKTFNGTGTLDAAGNPAAFTNKAATSFSLTNDNSLSYSTFTIYFGATIDFVSLGRK